MVTITGGCLCKAVRYTAVSEPLITRICWCRFCQYIGAGQGTVNVCFKSADVSFTGELKDFPTLAQSGSHMHRRFCPECGTHIISEAEERSHLIFIRAGTLDDPKIARPAAHIWTSEAPAWARMDEALPKFSHQPPPVVF